jgi:hypothetical protein
MIDPQSVDNLKSGIRDQIAEDRGLLDKLRAEVRPLKDQVRRILPRSTTSFALVGTDGGNNQIQFDPFLIQLIRVVDSSNNEYCLEVVSPTMDMDALSARQFNADGTPRTALGAMLQLLGLKDLTKLSHMIRKPTPEKPISPSWVQVYRELVEWAILFHILSTKDFGTDTIFVCDGLLRSKVFAGNIFPRILEGMNNRIGEHFRRNKRRILLTGVCKSSKVLDRYRLAMALEGILQTDYAAYVEIPRDLEQNAYIWSEYARGSDVETGSGEINKFVGGKMFFVKFGSRPYDPIWPVDIFIPQVRDAQVILGHMLADAIVGFPVPFYPHCLQKAHENAALVDFDFDILQDEIFKGIRDALGERATALDIFRIQDSDPSQRRYA